jgi:hypothetical protein
VFFDAMAENGFCYVLSEEDTGTGEQIHINSSATEWWVTFYKPQVVVTAGDLPNGFLADDRSDHEDFERVPYAFAFRSVEGSTDFVLISVHLKPGASGKVRRQEEFDAIAVWVDEHDQKEKDFIILGDMNIEDCDELADATPAGFVSLNDECVPTNTNVNGPKPYDHVMYQPLFTASEIDVAFDFEVVDLVEAMRIPWTSISSEPYPGEPYDHNAFRQYYSDHHPVSFRILLPAGGDDD